MAVALAFRVAIALVPIGVRVVTWSQGPAADKMTRWPKAVWDRLTDPGESDEALGAMLSDASGSMYVVATYTGDFEVRRLQVEWEFIYSGTPGEDIRVCTFHALKLTGGNPSSAWVDADFVIIENAMDAFWTAIKSRWPSCYILSGYRWYKAGPSITPPQEAVRVIDKNVPGTMTTAGTVPMPPQVAVSVTERTASNRAWGRFYLPPPGHWDFSTLSGRLLSSSLTVYADAADALYEAARTGNVPFVVYSTAKPSRETASGSTLPAIGARALTVDTLQIDDVPDVIRSRRFDTTLLRVQRGVGS